MNKVAAFILISTFLTLGTGSAHAFDGKRQGFQIGLGIGAHKSELTYKSSFAPTSIDAEEKVAVSLALGYGFSNRVVVFVGGKGGSVLINDTDASLAIGGIGATFYLSESSPSVYLTGLMGKASLAIDGQDEEHNDEGDGWLAGVGYELSERLHLELTHARADLVDPLNASNTSTLESSFLTLQYIWY